MNKLLAFVFIWLSVNSYSQTVNDMDGKPIPDNKFTITASGLKYYIYKKADGISPSNEDKVSVHYTGKFLNDTVFDSSIKRGQPITFSLGLGQVIKGWDEGILLLKKGEKAIFVIPPHLGYGSTARGSIPANSVLVFDVELVDVIPQPKIEPYKIEGLKENATPSGLKYYIVENGKGKKAKEGANVKVHYSGYFTDGKMFDSSVKRGEPFKFELGAGQVIKGWDEGLALMREGDKYRLVIPYLLAYGENGRPPQIPAKSDLVFDVELIQVTDATKVEPYDISKSKEYTTASGLKYYIVQEGSGDMVKPGQTVKVHYTGYFSNGKIFDSSVKRGEPISFQAGVGQVIKGWDEGLQLMKKGDKMRFIIPWNLAYGEKGYPGSIPPKADLTFDVELIDIIAK